jgi:hypothetical protein
MKVVTVDRWPQDAGADYRTELEAGNVVFFPTTPFPLPEDTKELLRNLNFAGGAVHKNVAYRTASDRVTGIEGPQAERVRGIMREYSRNVVAFTRELLPAYGASWKLDYASFRPVEEEGRDLPLNKRNDLIHTDAFPSRPTNGDLILRVFTNIHPTKPRSWITTDAFPMVAAKYAKDAGLDRIASGPSFLNRSAKLLRAAGLPVVARTPYDRFMLHFHEYLKRNSDFQQSCPKYRFDFPAGSTWLAFTDVLPHSVQSGQHALEQTFIIARHSLANPDSAPVAVLERLCDKQIPLSSG